MSRAALSGVAGAYRTVRERADIDQTRRFIDHNVRNLGDSRLHLRPQGAGFGERGNGFRVQR